MMPEIWMVTATDWAHYDQQVDTAYEFTPIVGQIVGFLIKETDDYVVLAHQRFAKEDDVRFTSVITKSSITEIVKLDGNAASFSQSTT